MLNMSKTQHQQHNNSSSGGGTRYHYVCYLEVGSYEDKTSYKIKQFDSQKDADEWVAKVERLSYGKAYDWRVRDSVDKTDQELIELKKQFWDEKEQGWIYGSNHPKTIELLNQYNKLLEEKTKFEMENVNKELREVVADIDPDTFWWMEHDKLTDLDITGAHYEIVPCNYC